MKLIVITQKVNINDDNLGFFHHWLEKLAEKTAELHVACLAEGEHHLPPNTTVYALGKEKGYSKLRQLFRLQKFLLRHLSEVDGVYCHMCPVYAVLSFPLAKIFRKKLILWYAHGSISWKLRLAEKLVDEIVTSSLAGCRLKSKKIKVLGQGIDTELFRPKYNPNTPNDFRILYAARLVPIKDHKTLIEAINILVNQRNIKNIKAKIIGKPLLESQQEYLDQLKSLVKNYNLQDYIEFLNGVSYFEMPRYYQEADLFVNPSSTGSLDKVVLEAMASGCLVLNCNKAYQEILPNKYLFKKGDAEDLAQKMVNLVGQVQDPALREIVIKNHDLDNLVEKVIQRFYV